MARAIDCTLLLMILRFALARVLNLSGFDAVLELSIELIYGKLQEDRTLRGSGVIQILE